MKIDNPILKCCGECSRWRIYPHSFALVLHCRYEGCRLPLACCCVVVYGKNQLAPPFVSISFFVSPVSCPSIRRFVFLIIFRWSIRPFLANPKKYLDPFHSFDPYPSQSINQSVPLFSKSPSAASFKAIVVMLWENHVNCELLCCALLAR
jgi:hypothetical protein